MNLNDWTKLEQIAGTDPDKQTVAMARHVLEVLPELLTLGRAAVHRDRKVDNLKDAWADEVERRKTAEARLALVTSPAEGVWFWNGVAPAELTDLTCPVVMSAATAQRLTERERLGRQLLKEAEWAAVDGRDFDSACPWCREWRCLGQHRPECRWRTWMELDPVP